MNMSPLFLRRQILGGFVSFIGVLVGRSVSAQVGSGGSGITQTIGKASLVVGSVTVRRAGQSAFSLAQDGTLVQGDRIETSSGSEVHITFDDGGYLALRPNSIVRIDQYVVTGDATDSATLNLIKGALRSVTGWIGKLDAPRYRITANTATIGVRGTDHEVVIVAPEDAVPGMDAGVHNRVNEGGTTLRNSNGVINIAPGTAAYSPGTGAAPVRHAVVPEFFNRLRTQREAAVVNHARNIRQHMEERLRERGKLQPNERFDEFRRRQSPLRQRRAGNGQPAGGASQPNAVNAASNDRQTARREQREERIRQRQERAAKNRQKQKELGGKARRVKE